MAMQSTFRLSNVRLMIALVWLLVSCQDVTNVDDMPTTRKWLRLELPRSHVAFGGDLHATLAGVNDASLPHFYKIRLSRLENEQVIKIATIPLLPDPTQSHLISNNTTRFTVPCGYFTKGGPYYIDILTNINSSEPQNEELTKTLDVRWPMPKLSITPEQIETYPELPITALLEFPEAVCEGPPSGVSAPPPAEFWLELLYCGHAVHGSVLCDGNNVTSQAQVLYSEQILGFPGRRTVTLRCELFGMAGDYALILRPVSPLGPIPTLDYTASYIKADWSSEFVLNVHARSVLPCGGATSGVRALFQYPACILENKDRVRVFGRVRAAVASLAPPSALHYVAEQRVIRGQHAVTFDCDLFSERFVEYCFVYVSQAISGAVADVRMDCIPTLPVSEGDAGAWGPWSSWSPCPAHDGVATCSAATRSRHRFCDSPPPRYGAKFCEGEAVETSPCTGAPECEKLPGSRIPTSVADTPEVVAEVGPGCRCGCVVHVSAARTARLVAGSTRACPGRSFWLIQADIGQAVRMSSVRVALPCSAQRLRARDGDSLAANMLVQWTGGYKEKGTQSPTDSEDIVTSDRFLLLELYSDELVAGGDSCAGGFITHAQQIGRNVSAARSAGVHAPASGRSVRGAGAAVAALAVAAGAAFAAIALAIHSAVRTRHYRRAQDKEELTDSDACSASLAWLQNEDGVEDGAGTARGSRSTLLSEIVEVVSMRKLRRVHQRLRESKNIDAEVCVDVHNQSDGYASDASSITLHNTPLPGCSGKDAGSKESKAVSAPQTPASGPTPSPLRRSKTAEEESKVVVAAGTDTLKRDHKKPTLSNMVTSVNSEPSTMVLDISASISSVTDKELDSVSEREIDSVGDKDSAKEKGFLMAHSRTSSAATLTNGCYSPALSAISLARVRMTNSKETKEQKNRRRLLHGGGPGSEFSLSTQEELELDYYDYEVNNAGAAPGSYLGMDPAFLVWIPPFDEEADNLYETEGKDDHLYEEILPKDSAANPGSNTESPEMDAPPLPEPRNIDGVKSQKDFSALDKVLKATVIHPLNFSSSDLTPNVKESPQFDRKLLNQRRESCDKGVICIPMTDLSNIKFESSPVRGNKNINMLSCDKSSTVDLVNNLVDVSDIQFADEDSDTSIELKVSPTDEVIGSNIVNLNKI